ncbi:MAG: hypothetical protein PHE50_05315 [Dehalococcoidales bacterium]|nr:hypothetical protein [Dehalococcoidales bacterium]
MNVFIQLIVTGKINSKADTEKVNEVLVRLQAKGATIKDIKLAATTNYSGLMGEKFGTEAVYVITYEAKAPIEI